MTLLTIWNEDSNNVILNENYPSEADARKVARDLLSTMSPETLVRCKISNDRGLDQDVLIKDRAIVGAYIQTRSS